MGLIERLFIAHPNSVNETYWQHLASACSFGTAMIAAGFACLLHGLLPFACVKTGSRAIAELHARMLTHRARAPRAHGAAQAFQPRN